MRAVDLLTDKKRKEFTLKEVLERYHPLEFKSFGRAALTLFIGTVYIVFVFNFLVFMNPVLYIAPWVS